MKTLIKKITSTNAEGVTFRLTEPASLNGGLKTTQWYVSWDNIGKALFGDQYSDAVTVEDLDKERGNKS